MRVIGILWLLFVLLLVPEAFAAAPATPAEPAEAKKAGDNTTPDLQVIADPGAGFQDRKTAVVYGLRAQMTF